MAIAIRIKDIFTAFLGSVDIPDENSGLDKYINNSESSEEDRKIAENLKNSLNYIERIA